MTDNTEPNQTQVTEGKTHSAGEEGQCQKRRKVGANCLRHGRRGQKADPKPERTKGQTPRESGTAAFPSATGMESGNFSEWATPSGVAGEARKGEGADNAGKHKHPPTERSEDRVASQESMPDPSSARRKRALELKPSADLLTKHNKIEVECRKQRGP